MTFYQGIREQLLGNSEFVHLVIFFLHQISSGKECQLLWSTLSPNALPNTVEAQPAETVLEQFPQIVSG